jgi:hypothetical protein
VPLFLLFVPVELLRFPVTTACFHMAYGVIMSLLLTEIMFFDFRKVPFTCAYFPGKINLIGLGIIYAFGFTAYSRTLARVEVFLSGKPLWGWLFLAAMLGCISWIARARSRSLSEAGSLDYEGAGDPEVRTLELAAG